MRAVGKNKLRPAAASLVVLACLLGISGCTSARDWWNQGLKVGPDYARPTAPVAADWIDAGDVRLKNEAADHPDWWTAFGDPVLNGLIADAYRQNLSLRVAGWRILEARAQRAIAAGQFFPQTQQATADYTHTLRSTQSVNFPLPDRQFSTWDGGFNLAWELDFWGRFRRGVEAADADLDASIENYDDVLVTLLADVATTYIEIRTLEERLDFVRKNIEAQRGSFRYAQARFEAGKTTEIDAAQAKTNLANTEALAPALETALRSANNRLCVLLGTTPTDLLKQWGAGTTPRPPLEVAVGLPADLLRRRSDVRRAERQLAAQSARLGVAEAEYYPHIAVTGEIGLQSSQFKQLFASGASYGSVGPSLRWNILNFGRIQNNVLAQDAVFQQLAVAYRETALKAAQEAENALVAFLRSQERLAALRESVTAAQKANDLIVKQQQEGAVDLNRVFIIQLFLTQQQDSLAQAEGDVAINLVRLYRALGGGWQIRLAESAGGDWRHGCAPIRGCLPDDYCPKPYPVCPSPFPAGANVTPSRALPANPPASE